uniref:Uncharacterized protein n=1 Tax=Rangifer tarandus platyrhynchus TaxID=3082113 RepID=A0ACB0DPS4_RANTA|nr:unnamed protein product [Rangifer tarandus platyrhynchus]
MPALGTEAEVTRPPSTLGHTSQIRPTGRPAGLGPGAEALVPHPPPPAPLSPGMDAAPLQDLHLPPDTEPAQRSNCLVSKLSLSLKKGREEAVRQRRPQRGPSDSRLPTPRPSQACTWGARDAGVGVPWSAHPSGSQPSQAVQRREGAPDEKPRHPEMRKSDPGSPVPPAKVGKLGLSGPQEPSGLPASKLPCIRKLNLGLDGLKGSRKSVKRHAKRRF